MCPIFAPSTRTESESRLSVDLTLFPRSSGQCFVLRQSMEHHRRGAPAPFDRRAPVTARALAGWRRESRPFGTIGASACRPASAGGATPRARESGLHGRAHRSHARRGRVLRRSRRGRGPSPPTRRRRSVLDHGTTVRARGPARRLTGRDCGQAVGARPVVRARARLERG